MKMNNILSSTAIFVGGALIGSAVTYYVVKTKYDKIIQEEIDSIREVYTTNPEKKEEPTEEDKAVEETEVRASIRKEYKAIMKDAGYDNEVNEEDEVYMEKPHVIAPDELGDCDYPILTLDYFEGDHTLVNDRGRIINNVAAVVGEDFAEHFGEFEEAGDDTVYIRNPKQRVDYEILRDYRAYSET